MLTKGAPEVVLPLCGRVSTPGGVVSMTPEQRSALVERNRALAGQARPVLALAYKPQEALAEPAEEGLTFAGLAAMSDPPPEAAEAIADARRAGIRVVMITGDHSLTASAVGREVGLEGETVEAKSLEEMEGDQLGEVIQRTGIFARAEPRHKVKILRALKEDHDVVIMTGDGVNHAPALHNADVGIAMGKAPARGSSS
jgi:Ca2+-transporting ATPase